MHLARNALLFVLLALASTVSFGRSEAIVNYENVPIPAEAGRRPTLAAIEQAIISAGLRQKVPWVVTERQAGRVRLSRLVRARQSAVIDVTFTAEAYSIRYVSSYKLGYRVRDGQETIDAKYNAGISEFRAELDRLLRETPDSQREPAG
jgi:hypothetical protein